MVFETDFVQYFFSRPPTERWTPGGNWSGSCWDSCPTQDSRPSFSWRILLDMGSKQNIKLQAQVFNESWNNSFDDASSDKQIMSPFFVKFMLSIFSWPLEETKRYRASISRNSHKLKVIQLSEYYQGICTNFSFSVEGGHKRIEAEFSLMSCGWQNGTCVVGGSCSLCENVKSVFTTVLALFTLLFI